MRDFGFSARDSGFSAQDFRADGVAWRPSLWGHGPEGLTGLPSLSSLEPLHPKAEGPQGTCPTMSKRPGTIGV